MARAPELTVRAVPVPLAVASATIEGTLLGVSARFGDRDVSRGADVQVEGAEPAGRTALARVLRECARLVECDDEMWRQVRPSIFPDLPTSEEAA